jgi:DNA-binding response OmpR family regulator
MARRTLLLVEDDAPLRRMYRQALAFEGFDVREAGDGFEALRLVDVELPAAIILDLIMPGVDGFAVLQELAAQAHLSQVPVVVVTGVPLDLAYLDVACILRKPAAPADLVAAVHRCLASAAPKAES